MYCWGSEWKELRPYISLLGCYIHQFYENLQQIFQLKGNGLDLVNEKKNKRMIYKLFFNLLIPTKANDPSVMTTVWKVSVYITALSPPEKRNSRISGHVQRTCLLDKRNAPWLSPKQIYVMNVEILDYLLMSKS